MRILLMCAVAFMLLSQTLTAQSFQIGAEAGLVKSFVKPGPDYNKGYDKLYFRQRGTIDPSFFINTRLNINERWAVIAGGGFRAMGYRFKQIYFGTDIMDGYTSLTPTIVNSELHLKAEYLIPLPANTALGLNIGIKAGNSQAFQYRGSWSFQPTASFDDGDYFKDSIVIKRMISGQLTHLSAQP